MSQRPYSRYNHTILAQYEQLIRHTENCISSTKIATTLPDVYRQSHVQTLEVFNASLKEMRDNVERFHLLMLRNKQFAKEKRIRAELEKEYETG